MRTLGRYFSLCLLALLAQSCNNVPVAGLQNSFSLKVNVLQKNTEPVKVDILWVIDNSASMCQEQASLGDSFDEFLKRISSFVNIDYRIAVVTTDVLSDGAGAFESEPAGEFPFACAQTEIRYCLRGEDNMCTQGYSDPALPPAGPLGDNWTCDAPDKVKNITNCNGSLNSKCRKLCNTHAECDSQFFGADQAAACAADDSACRYKCLIPSGDPSNSGCVLRPQTDNCPSKEDLYNILIKKSGRDPNKGLCPTNNEDVIPCIVGEQCPDGSQCPRPAAFLTPATAELYFKCVGVVGAEQHNNANLEQGLNAAIFALDRQGMNSAQAKEFLRKEAYLVLVFVSDEDDCSVADGLTLKKEQYGTCTCLSDTNGGGKLRPVSEAANRIKALKEDPGRVLVAAIVGDSTSDDPTTIEQDRVSYFESKCSDCADKTQQHPLLFNTYICESTAGKADYGSRYVEFVQRFGKNGILTNICSDAGVAPALDKIADRIIRVFTKICLPRPIQEQESLEIRKLGPAGTCGDGTPCCGKGAKDCPDPEECADGTECVANAGEPLLQSEEQDTQTYRIAVSSDCPEAAGKKAVFFNFLLEPGSGVSIDYLGVPNTASVAP